MMTQDECLQVEQNMILSNVEIRQISIKVETRKSKIINKKLVKMATKHFSWSSAFSILLLEDTDTFPYVPKI